MTIPDRNPLTTKNPNPQGKGLVPVLAHWHALRPRGAAAKGPTEIILDLFASTLVLSARCDLRPVPGQRYYLYGADNGWRLSLVSPEEWGERAPGDCLGPCWLREDMTWALQAEEALAANPGLCARVAALVQDFLERLDVAGPLAEQLPGYRRDLPYYRRLLAAGLGASLRQSLAAAGAGHADARETLRLGAAGLRQLALTAPQQAGEHATIGNEEDTLS
ncbi:DUF2452 domain-containing protein [Pseudohaliea rubra]|uniref:Uncharacterized protein n=1 Tax=Pseudohaliea rubra DSM 19751 TaxID=1265313 RepID=A0A095X251_9GAMM|nr:DUF2452 domain-containing protein [Pseudohaliea rubra]KGE04964.1 hypothetical protein HRUBRA_00437 [Pseudohaliea rubra DSM 19751]